MSGSPSFLSGISSHRRALYLLTPFLILSSAFSTYIYMHYEQGPPAEDLEILSRQVTVSGRLLSELTDKTADGASFAQRGSEITIDTASSYEAVGNVTFRPYGRVTISLIVNSSGKPKPIGRLKVDSNGNVKDKIIIPDTIPYGLHNIYILGESNTKEMMALYRNIYVYKTVEDLDGNGVKDKEQSCGVLIQESGFDLDKDGVDDVCDDFVDPASYKNPHVQPVVD